MLSITASEAGYDDISEPEDGLISNEDEVADLVDRARGELRVVIRNADQATRGAGKSPLYPECRSNNALSTAPLPSQNSDRKIKVFIPVGNTAKSPLPL